MAHAVNSVETTHGSPKRPHKTQLKTSEEYLPRKKPRGEGGRCARAYKTRGGAYSRKDKRHATINGKTRVAVTEAEKIPQIS
jgi:hypothetical protein